MSRRAIIATWLLLAVTVAGSATAGVTATVGAGTASDVSGCAALVAMIALLGIIVATALRGDGNDDSGGGWGNGGGPDPVAPDPLPGGGGIDFEPDPALWAAFERDLAAWQSERELTPA